MPWVEPFGAHERATGTRLIHDFSKNVFCAMAYWYIA
jgi:hypothetical protein